MADFSLVHGSCHGAWCWRDLIPELTTFGHSARAIDMPSHGSDPTPIQDVTLESCRDSILKASTPQSIIVAHSWGGYPVSAAAEADPNAMRGVIYLSAYVPQSGLSMIEMRKRAPRQLIGDAVEKSSDGLSYTVVPDRVHDLFYHDCPHEVVAYAFGRLCPQAIAPQATPLDTGKNFASVPKGYIRTTDDRTVPTEYQAEMAGCADAGMCLTIDSSHSPFFSHPEHLAGLMHQISERM